MNVFHPSYWENKCMKVFYDVIFLQHNNCIVD